MKRCPTCQSTYTDDSLDFCLQDGARLAPVSESSSSPSVNATWILPENPLSRRESPAPTKAADSRAAPTLQMPPTAQTVHQSAHDTAREAHFAAPPQKTTNPLLIVGVTVIVILLLALVGIGIALLLRNPAEEERGGTNANSTPNANNSVQTNESPSPSKANNQNTASSSNTNDGTQAQTPLRISTNASSTRVPLKAFTYYASHVLDKNMQTAWIEGASGPGLGEWIQCDFDREVKVNQVQLTPGYFKNASIWKQNNRLAAATLHFSDGTSRRYTFPDQMQQQSLDTGGIRTRFVRLVIEEAYRGSVDYEDTAISEISFNTEQ